MRRGKIKKIILVTLTAIIMTSILGCGGEKKNSSNDNIIKGFNNTGYPIVNEKLEIKVMNSVNPMNGNFNEMSMIKEINDKTNVIFTFEQIPSASWSEKKNLVLASGDLPDVFFGGGISDTDIATYSKQGFFLPLEDLIDKYAPNIKKFLDENQEVKKWLTTQDGHIYSLPHWNAYEPATIPDNMFINKKWLDKLGLEVPKTLDELYEVLKAFKTKDPNGNGKTDEIPLTYRTNGGALGETSLFGAFGTLDNAKHVVVEDGKIKYTANTDDYKEAIKWFNKLYKEGLIDKEVFTQDSTQYKAKGQDPSDIVGIFFEWFDENMVGVERAKNDFVMVEPLKGKNGEQKWGRNHTQLAFDKFIITSENPSPEATIRWIDEIFEEQMSIRFILGELDKNIKYDGEKYSLLPPPEGKSGDQYKYEMAPGPQTPGVITPETYKRIINSDDKVRKQERFEILDKYADKNPLPPIRFTPEQLSELSILTADIDKYIEEMKAKWITGERNVEEDWKGYLDQLEKMGIEKYIKIYQEGYDIYK